MLGTLIEKLRTAYGIRREELAAGICKIDMLKKYESEENEPEKLLADALLQRLGESPDEFFINLDAREYLLSKMRTWIQINLRQGRLEHAEAKIQEYAGQNGARSPLHCQFLQLMRAELLHRRQAPAAKQKEAILTGLRLTLGSKEITPELLNNRSFHLLELLLLERYAIILDITGECTSALIWYEKLIQYLTYIKRDSADLPKLYPLAAYRLAVRYTEVENYSAASLLIDRAIGLMTYTRNQNTLFIMLVELRLKISEKLGRSETYQQNELEHIRKIAEESNPFWHENFYPLYTERNICCVNYLILERRLFYDIRREDLVEGVCDVRTLERIEKGNSRLQKRIRKGLLKKLDLSWLKYNPGFITNCMDDYLKLKKIKRLYQMGRYREAESIRLELTERIEQNRPENRAFFVYWETILQFRLEHISKTECQHQLWTKLCKTAVAKQGKPLFSCHLMEYERNALLTILHESNEEEVVKLLPLLKAQYRCCFNLSSQITEPDFYQELLLNIIKIYLTQGELLRVDRFIMLGFKQICFCSKETIWDRLLFSKFCLEELKLQKRNKISKTASETSRWLKAARTFAELTGNNYICILLDDYIKNNQKTSV